MLAISPTSELVHGHTEEHGKKIWDECTGNPYSPYRTDEEFEKFLDHSKERAKRFPTEFSERLHEFGKHGNGHGVLLVRGLPVDDTRLGPTPRDWSNNAQVKLATETETYLLAVTAHLGEVFAFQRQHDGNLIQNIAPIKKDAFEQMGTGSRVFLQWHTEDSYDSLRAEFIGILCVRSDPQARTAFAYVRDVRLSDEDKEVLLQPRFRLGVDLASGGNRDPQDGPVISVLVGDGDDLGVRVDTGMVAAQRGDDRAAEALEHFKNAVPAAAQYVRLQAGDLLILDNMRTMHARTEFTPRYDGTDRWLQRVSITTDLDRSRAARTRRARVIDEDARFFG